MATYTELRAKFSDDTFRNKVTFAVVAAAYDMLQVTPTAADRAYASAVFSNPDAEGRRVTMAILAANKSASLAVIDAATDATIQTQVDAVVPELALAFSGA